MKKTLLLSAMTVLTLSACNDEPEDLQNWINQTRQEASKTIQPVDVPTVTPILTYTPPAQPSLDAFNSKRLNTNQQGVNAPNPDRPKEVLEGFALENLRYVGSFKKGNQLSAFIEADGHVYTVHTGNYLGQNHGRISQIHDDRLVITELVEDAYGNWTFRPTELTLNATTQK